MKKKDKKEADKIIEQLNNNSLALGKNHKQMSGELSHLFQVSGRDGVRVQYTINENGEKEIVNVFVKENHKNTSK